MLSSRMVLPAYGCLCRRCIAVCGLFACAVAGDGVASNELETAARDFERAMSTSHAPASRPAGPADAAPDDASEGVAESSLASGGALRTCACIAGPNHRLFACASACLPF